MDHYRELHRRGLTTSLRHFSRHWLGAAENYACSRGERGLSRRALRRLHDRLWQEGRYLLAIRLWWSLLRSGGAVQ